MTRRAWIGLVAVLVAGCRSTTAGVGDVPTFEVPERDVFVRRIRADGVLRAVEATPVAAPPNSQGPMKIAWLAADGSRVEKGDVVVKFDASEMEKRLADSRDDVASAERQIDKVALDSGATRTKREKTAELAEAEATAAKQFETTDEKILSRVEIIEGAIDLELAQAKAGHAREVKTVERSVASNQLELHEIDRSRHAKEVEHAEASLAKLQVTAPHPGIFVLARDYRGEPIRVGDTVWSGQDLAELPLVDTLEAEVFVLEADAGSIAEGLPAEVVVDAHPQATWGAKVRRIDALAQPKHPDVPVHYFGITLQLDRTDTETMRVGQRVSATILVEKPDTVVVPRQAVFERDGRTVVYRAAVGGFEPVDVTLGVSSAGRVVVESGIEPGDRIALRDPTKAASELLGDSDGDDKTVGAPGGPR